MFLTRWNNSHMRVVNKIFNARKECCCHGHILVPRGHTMAAGCHSAVQYSTTFFTAPHLSAKITKCTGESHDGSGIFFFWSGPKFNLLMYRQESRDTGSRLVDLNAKLLSVNHLWHNSEWAVCADKAGLPSVASVSSSQSASQDSKVSCV